MKRLLIVVDVPDSYAEGDPNEGYGDADPLEIAGSIASWYDKQVTLVSAAWCTVPEQS